MCELSFMRAISIGTMHITYKLPRKLESLRLVCTDHRIGRKNKQNENEINWLAAAEIAKRMAKTLWACWAEIVNSIDAVDVAAAELIHAVL
jgi:hypothetical protein